jgi:hypothetical protein
MEWYLWVLWSYTMLCLIMLISIAWVYRGNSIFTTIKENWIIIFIQPLGFIALTITIFLTIIKETKKKYEKC